MRLPPETKNSAFKTAAILLGVLYGIVVCFVPYLSPIRDILFVLLYAIVGLWFIYFIYIGVKGKYIGFTALNIVGLVVVLTFFVLKVFGW